MRDSLKVQVSLLLNSKTNIWKDKDPEKFVFNKKPCPFLKDNLCSHYTYRPKDCISYPHLHKSGFILD
ncbi:MAG: YkgJ family cysteine cluster protein [Deltaproteobacteria bacterium]|nr:YkgJ family cysteine cluster protein [Deltaproteobacteria bacterium]